MSRINYLDISELNDRLEELEALRTAIDDAREAVADADDDDKEEAQEDLEDAIANFSEEEKKELAELEDLKSEIGESRGKISEEGGPFVDTSDFQAYAQELADDLGLIPDGAPWPLSCIDWEQAAKELSADYSVITYGGTDYYYRA